MGTGLSKRNTIVYTYGKESSERYLFETYHEDVLLIYAPSHNMIIRHLTLVVNDEPEATLSITNTLFMLNIIDGLVKKNSQFIITTYSPILIAYPNATIYEIDDNQIKQVEYSQSTNYMVTKYFLENYKKMLNDIGILD